MSFNNILFEKSISSSTIKAPSKMKDVSLIINSLAGGGAEILNIKLARKLGMNRIFITQQGDDYDTHDVIVEPLFEKGGKVNELMEYFKTPLYAFRLSKSLQSEKVIVASLFRSALVISLYKLFFKKQVSTVFWIHTDPQYLPKKFYAQIYKWVNGLVYKGIDSFIVNSKNAQRTLSEFYKVAPERIKVAYNFFDINEIAKKASEPIEENYSKLYTNKTIVVVGRLVELKGHKFLLKAFKIISDQIPEARLLVLGGGVEEDNLKSFVEKSGLLERVHFLGFQKNPFKYIAHAQIMAFASTFEGFGNVLVESLACGTPVLSSDIDNGPREILAPKTDIAFRTKKPENTPFGWLMPKFVLNETNQEEINIWANKIIEIFLEGTYQIPKENLINRAKEFDLDIISKNFENLLLEFQEKKY